MPQSLSKVYVHIVFSTKYRKKLIRNEIKESLFEYIGGICRELECNQIKVGGHEDHIHVLCMLSRKISIMKLLEEVKKSSSRWIKTKGDKYSDFYWQGGYGIFSVNPKDVEIVKNYIKTQEEHHSKQDFKTEFRGFLKKNHVDYDKRYVWD